MADGSFPAVAALAGDGQARKGSHARRGALFAANEDFLDRQAEQIGDAKGEGERRVIFARFDGIDRLA